MRSKWKAFILILVHMCTLLFGALAEPVSTLKTAVPSTHTITFFCKGDGGVRIDGVLHTGAFEVEVPRLEDVIICAEPAEGCRLHTITVSPKKGTDIEGGRVTLHDLYEDKHIEVTFVQLGAYQPTDEELLYDTLLGTGHGHGQLHIVFDEDWVPQDYGLMPIRQGSTLYIEAHREAQEAPDHRSLLLRASQVQRLIEEEEMTLLHLRNDAVNVTMDMTELTTGPMAWLLRQSRRLGLENVCLEAIPTDAEDLARVKLNWWDLDHNRIELRTVPDETEKDAWQVQVFLRADETELDVTALVTTLRVDFAAPPLKPEVEEERLQAGTIYWLPAEQEPDRCEGYTVVYDEDHRKAEVFRQAETRIAPIRLLVQEALFGEDERYRPDPE